MKPTVIFLIFLSLLASACTVSRTEVDTLSARVWDQDQQQRRLQGQLTAMDQELTRLLAEMEGVSTPMRATQANLWAEIESLRVQTATMRGQMEELQLMVQNGRRGEGEGQVAELSRQVDYLDRSVAMIASQMALDLGPRPTQGVDAPGVAERPDQRAMLEPELSAPGRPQPPMTEDTAQALYDRALDAFQNRDYVQAQRMWDEFVRTFTDHSLVSNALFWQGESFFQMEDYGQAVLAYQDVISKHPQSNKYAASMLKQGVSFYRLGKDRAGTLVLEDLINRFPDLPEATRAKNLLAEQQN
ncbi:tol-pal system protein YbgF [Desulfonatronum thiosulfatophilum]|uniref:Tol-pal system protein YbgF n=1 Tax=Desulfonatronum thiosulfatophilum TaxID=617002 RepID=A0A1G6ELY9_9BACT|nr:tol-pal system protein YbgF [Desulfonatronum thiosulfatophilum]SDB58408.1 tol-pal system protein YbgF [Desulfonatronum thiosulfatophilum]